MGFFGWTPAACLWMSGRAGKDHSQLIVAQLFPTALFLFLFFKFYFPSFPSLDATTARASRYNVIVFLLAIPRSPTKFPTP
jgi:hypothetical protein